MNENSKQEKNNEGNEPKNLLELIKSIVIRRKVFGDVSLNKAVRIAKYNKKLLKNTLQVQYDFAELNIRRITEIFRKYGQDIEITDLEEVIKNKGIFHFRERVAFFEALRSKDRTWDNLQKLLDLSDEKQIGVNLLKKDKVKDKNNNALNVDEKVDLFCSINFQEEKDYKKVDDNKKYDHLIKYFFNETDLQNLSNNQKFSLLMKTKGKPTKSGICTMPIKLDVSINKFFPKLSQRGFKDNLKLIDFVYKSWCFDNVNSDFDLYEFLNKFLSGAEGEDFENKLKLIDKLRCFDIFNATDFFDSTFFLDGNGSDIDLEKRNKIRLKFLNEFSKLNKSSYLQLFGERRKCLSMEGIFSIGPYRVESGFHELMKFVFEVFKNDYYEFTGYYEVVKARSKLDKMKNNNYRGQFVEKLFTKEQLKKLTRNEIEQLEKVGGTKVKEFLALIKEMNIKKSNSMNTSNLNDNEGKKIEKTEKDLG